MDQIKKAIITEYWVKKLSGELPKISLPFIANGEEEKTVEPPVRSPRCEIPQPLAEKLFKSSKNSDIALFILFLSGINVVLSRYSGSDDVVVGTLPPAADGDDKSIIFSRTRIYDRWTNKELITQTKDEVLEAVKFKGLSPDEMVEVLRVKRNTDPPDIFNAAFLYEPYQVRHQSIDRFDLVLILTKQKNRLALQVEDHSFRSSEILTNLSQNVIMTLDRMLADTSMEISVLDILNPGEKNRLLYEFNHTEAGYPRDKALHRLFKEQVERTPDQVALVGPKLQNTNYKLQTNSKIQITNHQHGGALRADIEASGGMAACDDLPSIPVQPVQPVRDVRPVQLTYTELDGRSDELAGWLIENGVKPDTIVAIMIERSVEMIIGIMGILKAGGAYLPIEPGYPQERIDFMLKDSGAKLVVSDRNDVETGYCPAFIVDLNHEVHDESRVQTHLPAAGHRPPAAPLAYVIYTSGTTGKPKGVMIEHRSLVNFIKGITDIIPFTGGDRILSLTTISFDIFGLETHLPLITGTPVVIGSRKEQLDALAAARQLVRQRITIFQVTPSRLQLLLLEKEIPTMLKSLQILLVGGEVFPAALLEKIRSMIAGKIYNLYGPTETTIWSTIKDVTGTQPLNIGRPIANTRVYILNRTGFVQPVGVPGEMVIAGDGVSRGYLNHPELTSEKFRSDVIGYSSFVISGSSKTKGRTSALFPITPLLHPPVYLTGDMARWLPDGNIEFLGRMDFQVKIRGFRVELGEIENVLLKQKGIKEAVVLVNEAEAASSDSTKSLAAYIVPTQELNVSQLREYLSAELPPYMIPSTFIKADRIPLTPNGKVDRKALAAYAASGTAAILSTGVKYVAPRNNIEKAIADIWQEILNLEEVGVNESFFDLGGTSLDIYKLNAKFKEVFNEDELVLKIFRYPTVGALAEYLSRKKVGIDDYHQMTGRTVPVDKVKKNRSELKSKRRGNKHVSIQ